MKIATYNVNGISGRLPVLLRWLESAGPEIVCLQELKAPQEKFPEAAIRSAGYGAIWQGQKSWNGFGRHGRWRSKVWIYPGGSSIGSDARQGLRDHPTVKTTAMLEDALLDLTHRGEIVLDPFLGSGRHWSRPASRSAR